MGSLGQAILELTADQTKLDAGLTAAKNKVGGALTGMKGQLSAFGIAAGTMMGNLAANAVQAVTGAIVNAAKDSLKGYIDYAAQVRDTARSLGVDAEQASRLIQVADDVTISYESMTASMKYAQKEGIDVSIEGLARLADQYLALEPGIERQQFLFATFGRQGAEMGKLLEQGSAGIYAMSEAIDESQVLTEEAVQNARNYEIAIDELNDAWDGFIYRVAPPVIKAMQSILAVLEANVKGMGAFYDFLSGKISFDELGRVAGEASSEALKKVNDSIMGATNSVNDLGRANQNATGTFDEAADGMSAEEKAAKDLEEQLKKLSEANKEALNFTLKYADFQHDYAEQHKDAVEAVTEAEQKLSEVMDEYGVDSQNQADAITKVTIAQHKLNDAIDKYGAGSDEAAAAKIALNNAMEATSAGDEKIADATAALDDAKAKIGELEASWHEKTQRMIYDMVVAKLSIDGLTDAEYDASIQLAVTMGIMTQAEADHAKAMMEQANALVAGIAATEKLKTTDPLKDAEQSAEGTKAAVDGVKNSVDETTQAIDATTVTQNAMTAEVAATSEAINAEIENQARMTAEVQATLEAQKELNASKSLSSTTSSGDASSVDGLDAGSVGKESVNSPSSPFRSVFADLGKIGGLGFMGGFQENIEKSLNRVMAGAAQTVSRNTQFHTTINNPVPEPASNSMDKTYRKISYLGVKE